MFSFFALGFINFYALSAFINFLTSISFGIYIFFKEPEKKLNQSFALFALSLAAWSFGYFFWQIADTADGALFWGRGLMMGAVFVAVTFTHFVFVLLNLLPRWNGFILGSYVLFSLFAIANLTPYFVSGVAPIMDFPFWPQPGILYHPYLALWVGYLFFCGGLLIHRLFHTNDPVHKKQIQFILAAMAAVFLNGPMNYLPWYGIEVPPVTTILVSLYVIVVGYAVLKYRLLNVRVVATELLVMALTISILIRTLLSESLQDFFINLALLAIVSILGVLLIMSVRNEVVVREKVEKLATRLEKANKRLRQLDQMKSEFVSIASHQLRSPLTSIRGYASMLLEGSYGKIPKKAEEALERISDSSLFMAESVEDYLNVSRIEAGNMKYELIDFTLKDEVSEVIDDMRREAVKKGLVLTLKSKIAGAGVVNADIGKTRQILHNLINNALKYTPAGTIQVYIHDNLEKKEIVVDVIDTGIGMSKQTLEDVFGKFERAHNANEVNVTGTGLGLFIARKIARDMQGDVIAVSGGEGEGSTFSLILPLKN